MEAIDTTKPSTKTVVMNFLKLLEKGNIMYKYIFIQSSLRKAAVCTKLL